MDIWIYIQKYYSTFLDQMRAGFMLDKSTNVDRL